MHKQTGLLRGVCLLGLVVFLVLLGMVIFLSIQGGIPFLSSGGLRKSSFALALEEYDQKILNNPNLTYKQHNSLLDSLEKKTLDIENTLSVLKRRRNLALRTVVNPTDIEQYRSSYGEAAAKARKQYPYSAQISALAAETLIINGLLSETQASEIQDLAIHIYQGALTNVSLAFSVFSDAMGDPASGRHLPRELFTLLCSLSEGEEREKYLVNSCIRTLLENNFREAIVMVNSIFKEIPLRDETIRFGAEFFYDHGDFRRSAELFSSFTDSQSLARQADALWLGGFTDSARGMWQTATAKNRTGGTQDDEAGLPSIKSRSFYNLASTTSNAQEAGRWLEQLFAANAEYQPGQVFGIIRYSRIAPADRAIAILSETDLENEELFDLELLRRKSEDWETGKTVAETWKLLNRHPKDERLYEWAVWYFDFQHRYDETALALRDAGINRVEGPWSALHRAYTLVREKQFAEAEKALRSIVRSPQETRKTLGRRTQPLWQASADLAMLLQKQQKYQEAFQYFEIAAGQLAGLTAGFSNNPPAESFDQTGNEEQSISAAGISLERRDAAKIQLYMAKLLQILGKKSESMRAIDYALDLDPENLEARVEKRRLDTERGYL